ncbi:MAG TPA: hypothetical protein VLZ54_06365, partial [Arenibacter sp.]|nr:hypothetical protein [Arenibacter sp.]
MKNLLPFFLLTIALLGCKNEERLVFEPQEIKSENCKNCPEVAINIPKALNNDPLSATINNALT